MSGGADRTPGTALALSGGGFRATLFHLGSLWRLNELGMLRRLKVVTSVSGGSITAGWLGCRWKDLAFGHGDVATNFAEVVVAPLRAFCSRTHDVQAVLLGALPLVSGGEVMAAAYDRHLFGGATLQALPDEAVAPRFILYATSLQSGVSVRLSRTFLRDYTVGLIRDPEVSLARAVAASSAFPPFLSPVTLDTSRAAWEREEGNVHHADRAFTRRLVLTDGGVYDNMGLEAVQDRYQTVLVSDAGAPRAAVPSPGRSWLPQASRAIAIAMEQGRSLRRRWLVGDLEAGRARGAYWSIGTRIADYQLPDAIARDDERSGALAGVRTRLDRFREAEQRQLVNWGYALADAALRRFVVANQRPGAQPYPDQAL